MADAFCGEIRPFAFGVAPKNWLPCDGKTYPIQLYPGLSSVLGQMYGGDGQKTFAVPNLSGSVVIGCGTGADNIPYPQGKAVGTDTVTLSDTQMPMHDHVLYSQPGRHLTQQSALTILGSLIQMPQTSSSQVYPSYTAPTSDNQIAMSPAAIGSVGGGQAHDNHQPYMLLNYYICTSTENYPLRQ